MSPVRLVLVDDHRMVRSGVRAELDEDLRVVAEAGDVDDAVEQVRTQLPDVVLLDVHLPGGQGGGGAEVLRRCAGLHTGAGQPVRFLALSVSDAAADVISVIRAGARGYVTKTIDGPSCPTRCDGWPTATPCSPRAWPGSCSTPSARARRTWPRWTTSSTG